MFKKVIAVCILVVIALLAYGVANDGQGAPATIGVIMLAFLLVPVVAVINSFNSGA